MHFFDFDGLTFENEGPWFTSEMGPFAGWKFTSFSGSIYEMSTGGGTRWARSSVINEVN